MFFVQLSWFFEKSFGGNGKEFGRVGRAVFVHHAFFTSRRFILKFFIFSGKDPGPGGIGGSFFQDRGAVGDTVRLVQLVGEFMHSDVLAVLKIRRAAFDTVPGQDHDAPGP